MRKRGFCRGIAFLVPAGLGLLFTLAVGAEDGPAIERIAFGSCNAHDKPQPIWHAVVDADPDLWIWTGDIVYADTDSAPIMRAKYNEQRARPEYRKLLAHCPVIGVWDDHDYGRNDAGAEYPSRVQSQRALLDFLDEPAESARRAQRGVYTSYAFGPAGKRLKIILLDTRYHRDAPGPDGDVLGAAQWTWFEKELRTSDAQLNLIVSSIQVIPTEQPFEKWGRFPRSRERLLRLIRDSAKAGVLIVSGDRHIAEISVEDSTLAHPLFEITSSGLTHSWEDFPEEENRYRVGSVFTGLNFGMIEVDWKAKPIAVSLQVRDVDGTIVRRQRVPLANR